MVARQKKNPLFPSMTMGLYSVLGIYKMSCPELTNTIRINQPRPSTLRSPYLVRNAFVGNLIQLEMSEKEYPLESVLRCGDCKKPFDKREWYFQQAFRGCQVINIVWHFRIHLEEARILLSVSTKWWYHQVSIMHLLCQAEVTVRQDAASMFHVQGQGR